VPAIDMIWINGQNTTESRFCVAVVPFASLLETFLVKILNVHEI
jgi:hypothetical protein